MICDDKTVLKINHRLYYKEKRQQHRTPKSRVRNQGKCLDKRLESVMGVMQRKFVRK